MLLRQRKSETVVANEAQQLGALVERNDQGSYALHRGAPPDAGEVFIDDAFFARAEPSEVEGETRHLAEQRPDVAPRQHAELHVGQRLDAVLRRVEHGRLQAKQIPGQQEIQNLPAAVRQRLEAERPAGIERVKLRAVLAGVNDFGAGRQLYVLLLQRIDGGEFFRRDRLEQSAGAQFTLVATELHPSGPQEL